MEFWGIWERLKRKVIRRASELATSWLVSKGRGPNSNRGVAAIPMSNSPSRGPEGDKTATNGQKPIRQTCRELQLTSMGPPGRLISHGSHPNKPRMCPQIRICGHNATTLWQGCKTQTHDLGLRPGGRYSAAIMWGSFCLARCLTGIAATPLPHPYQNINYLPILPNQY